MPSADKDIFCDRATHDSPSDWRTPTVSVVIPTYNRAHYLLDSIDSVLAQGFPGTEIVIIDDGSTDNTTEVLAKYGRSIRAFRQENAGFAAARIRGVQESRSDLIAWHDSDDVMLAGRLHAQVSFLCEHPEVAAVTGNLMVQGREGSDYLASAGVEFDGRPWVVFRDGFQALLARNFMADPASMVRKDRLWEIGGYDLTLRSSADWDLWLRMVRRWSLACMALPCTWVRKHEGNLSASPVETACNIRVMDKALRCGEPIDVATRGIVLRRLFRTMLGYLALDLDGQLPPADRIDLRSAISHLPWRQRCLVGSAVAMPRYLAGPLLTVARRVKRRIRGETPYG